MRPARLTALSRPRVPALGVAWGEMMIGDVPCAAASCIPSRSTMRWYTQNTQDRTHCTNCTRRHAEIYAACDELYQ